MTASIDERQWLWKAGVLCTLLASGPAFANDAGLLECRKLTSSTQRLACYDALPATAPPGAATPAAAPRRVEDGFGLNRPAPARSAEPEAIESQIQGRFEGWEPNDRITLANGQVWQISDSSRAALDLVGPKVKVVRGWLGSFFLQIEGTNRSPRVRRVN